MADAGRETGAQRGVDDRLLSWAGWASVAVVVVSSALRGLPDDTGRAVTVVAVTAAGLLMWCAALRLDEPLVLAPCLVGTGVAGAALIVLDPAGPGYLLSFMAAAAVGLRLQGRVARVAAIVVVLTAAAAEAAVSRSPWGAALNVALGTGFVFVASTFAALSRDAHTRAEELLAQEAATRAAKEEAAALAERGRLARELHDVLAHTLSGLAVKLEGARLLARHTGADPRLLDQIDGAHELARDGMTDARQVVATLRGDALPGPAQLPALLERTRRAAGIPVTFSQLGDPHPLPPDSALTLYRTVQEALTNTAKYAGDGAAVDVLLRWQPDRVVAEIVDAGGGAEAAGLPSGGFGLTGLAERAALAGGRLETGATGDGWRVVLTMPVPCRAAEERTAW